METFVEEGDALCAEQMEEAKYFVNELRDIHGVEVCIMPNDDSFHELIFAPHIPRVLLRWDASELGLTGKDADEATTREAPRFPEELEVLHLHHRLGVEADLHALRCERVKKR